MRRFSFVAVLLVSILPFWARPGWADESTARLDLKQPDIHAVVVEEHAAWLKLTPDATAKLAELTRIHQGQLLVVTIDGIPALRSRIFAPVDSGVLQIDAPSQELRLRLKKMQKLPKSSAP